MLSDGDVEESGGGWSGGGEGGGEAVEVGGEGGRVAASEVGGAKVVDRPLLLQGERRSSAEEKDQNKEEPRFLNHLVHVCFVIRFKSFWTSLPCS